ncbi:MAG: hypothetical protein HY872_08100 [Chloroflexi bacterium]|nr:hypothetical protein [Chloroflexota bacterium]MBI4315940.1 hypothetical protein [Chloroflexota bacterium]MBI5291823.1 hypothetical protein [Chloroflexota bacterium]
MIRPSLILLGLVVGLGFGLLYGWVISPVSYTDTRPAVLRADYKDQYVILIADAYAADGNLTRAGERLATLGLPAPAEAVAALAQRLTAEGKDASALAALAADLGLGIAPVTPRATVALPPTPTATQPPTETPLPTATTAPTQTPTATPVYDFTLLSQENYCNDLERKPLIIVDVVDAQGNGLPGVKVTVNWANGQDGFVTGLKPEISASYGDFAMDVGTSYSVQLGSRTPPVAGLAAPMCVAADGAPYPGAVRLVFQRGG